MKAIITLVLCTMLISCNSKEQKNIDVVTTIKPIQMLVAAIAGEHLQSIQLIPDGTSPHHYALKPSDIKQLHNAKVIFRIDENLEYFLNKTLQQVSKSVQIISLADSEGVNLIPLENKDKHTDHQQYKEYSHDLHIWLDPINAIAMCNAITRQLIQIDPAHSNDYTNKRDNLIAKIQSEDKKLIAKLKPISNKPFMVFHNAWGYFENHYGLKNVTVINQTPTSQLGIAKIQAVRETIKTKKIECLFKEPQFQAAILQTLTKGSDVKISELDVLGSTIKINPNSYPELLNTIADGLLKCQ